MKPYYQEDGITIYHGDCRDILPHLEPVDLVLTDPPYGENQAEWDKQKPPDVIWDLIVSAMNDGSCLYYWGFWGHADWILINAKRVGLFPQSQLTWWFRTGRPEKKAYREDTESCWYFSLGEPKIFNAEDYLEPYEDESNYKRYNRIGKHPGTVFIASRILHNHPENYNHPTQKPLSVIRKLVGISSDQNSTILDPFMGSGTTLVAAQQLGRSAIGIEIEERYCEIAIERLRQGVLGL